MKKRKKAFKLPKKQRRKEQGELPPLPAELLSQIFAHLNLRDLYHVSLVCHTWFNASNANFLWARQFRLMKTSNPAPLHTLFQEMKLSRLYSPKEHLRLIYAPISKSSRKKTTRKKKKTIRKKKKPCRDNSSTHISLILNEDHLEFLDQRQCDFSALRGEVHINVAAEKPLTVFGVWVRFFGEESISYSAEYTGQSPRKNQSATQPVTTTRWERQSVCLVDVCKMVSSPSPGQVKASTGFSRIPFCLHIESSTPCPRSFLYTGDFVYKVQYVARAIVERGWPSENLRSQEIVTVHESRPFQKFETFFKDQTSAHFWKQFSRSERPAKISLCSADKVLQCGIPIKAKKKKKKGKKKKRAKVKRKTPSSSSSPLVVYLARERAPDFGYYFGERVVVYVKVGGMAKSVRVAIVRTALQTRSYGPFATLPLLNAKPSDVKFYKLEVPVRKEQLQEPSLRHGVLTAFETHLSLSLSPPSSASCLLIPISIHATPKRPHGHRKRLSIKHHH